MKLQRHPANPILLPDPTSDWECYNVFNPGVLYHNGLFHMF
ncbi:MAG: glycosidase, partial [Thermoproteota archaeon]